jgi:hypothetical protein
MRVELGSLREENNEFKKFIEEIKQEQERRIEQIRKNNFFEIEFLADENKNSLKKTNELENQINYQ